MSTSPTALERLRTRTAELYDLRSVASLVEWDQFVMMPSGGAAARAYQSATIQSVLHEKAIAPELGQLIEAAAEEVVSLPDDSIDAAIVRAARRDYEKETKVPLELAGEIALVASQAAEVWADARQDDDYARFRPWLDRMLDLQRRYAACFAADDPYDALLDAYEEGLTSAQVERVFARLEPELRALVDSRATDDLEPFEAGPYAPEAQHQVSLEVTRAFGASEVSFRLDPTVHPFCLPLAVNDIRLTTRYMDDLADHSLFSTMHEVGHGLYEHGVDPRFERTPLGQGLSMALHESQSRLWENVIGRSLPFWSWFYPRMQAAHPDLLGGVPLARFHRAVNSVRRSLIRVSADEVSYGLHIILRFELERALLSGGLSTADLPEAWNARFEELLGVRPPNDRLGCLQDTHWASGLVGYFPTYQLGNVMAVQIWERLRADIPDADDQIAQGEFGAIHGWLREHLYRLGRMFTPAETLRRVVGGPIDPEPYLRYLTAKTAA